MHIVGSALKGYAIDASDGPIGTVKTFLFDDLTWKIRWLVIDTGDWLSGRQVLVHPSAIAAPDHQQQRLPVTLTRAQVEASPDIQQDRPVTMQMQRGIYDYYGWDPHWGPNVYSPTAFGLGAFASFAPSAVHQGGSELAEAEAIQLDAEGGDPHLRDMTAVRGYHIHATDGAIGHVENFLIDDAAWAIRYLIVDTRNWWPGQHVLIAPYAVTDIDWGDRNVQLNVTCDQVKSSPPWNPGEMIESFYQRRLHEHYGWSGYGW